MKLFNSAELQAITPFSPEWWSNFAGQALGGLLAGLVVFGVGETILFSLRARRETRVRRQRIYQLTHHASTLLERAVAEGRISALASIEHEYVRANVEAVALFMKSEEEVARWSAYEFFAAYQEAKDYLEGGAARTADTLSGIPGATRLRYERLAGWATFPAWPWLRDPGPLYAWEGREGDTARHRRVPPNSDSLAGTGLVMPPFMRASGKKSIRAQHREWQRNRKPWSAHPRS